MADRPNNRGRKSRKKVCGFCVDKVEHIDYKDIAISVTSQLPSSVRVTSLCFPIQQTKRLLINN